MLAGGFYTPKQAVEQSKMYEKAESENSEKQAAQIAKEEEELKKKNEKAEREAKKNALDFNKNLVKELENPDNQAQFQKIITQNPNIKFSNENAGEKIEENDKLFYGTDSNTENISQDNSQNPKIYNLSANEQDTLQTAQDLQNATMPKMYRNTGVTYFDTKENLGLADVYLAKLLGLDVKRVDMNVNMNANVKMQDIGKTQSALNNMASTISNLNTGMEEYADENAGNWSGRTATQLMDLPYGFGALYQSIPFIGPDTTSMKQHALNNDRSYAYAKILTGGGKPTNMTITDAKSLASGANKTPQAYYANQAVINQRGLDEFNSVLRTAEMQGIPLTPEQYYRRDAIEKIVAGYNESSKDGELTKSTRDGIKAMQLLQTGRPDDTTKAIQLIYGNKKQK